MERSWYPWWCGYLLYAEFSPENCSSCSEEISTSVTCKLEYMFWLSLSVSYNENSSFPSFLVMYFSSTPYVYLANCILIFLSYQAMPFNSDLCHWHFYLYLWGRIFWSLALLQLVLIGRQRVKKKKKWLVSLNITQFYSLSAVAIAERLEFVLKNLQFSSFSLMTAVHFLIFF